MVFIKKCDILVINFNSYYEMHQFYYKMRQLLQNAPILLQNATVMTKCVVYYKMHWYNIPIQRIFTIEYLE